MMTTDSPQPQASVWFGLLKTKRAPSFSRLKSISVPIRNMTALGSMKMRTPLSSTTSSSGPWLFGIIHRVAHAGAAAIGHADAHADDSGLRTSAMMSRMRAAAASVSRIDLGPFAALTRGCRCHRRSHQNMFSSSFASSLHAVRRPGRIEGHVHRDLADALHRLQRVLAPCPAFRPPPDSRARSASCRRSRPCCRRHPPYR